MTDTVGESKNFDLVANKIKEEKSKIVHKEFSEELTPPSSVRSDHTNHRPKLDGYKGLAHKVKTIKKQLLGLD